MSKRITIADVAARAGVDRSLVSRVLNDDPALRAREETRQRVRQAVQELGYQPNRIARSLRTATSNTLGLVIPSFENPIWAVVVDGAETEADARGKTLIVASAARTPGRVQQFLDFGAHGGLDGILIASAGQTDTPPANTPVPWLLLNRRAEGSRRYLLLDDEAAAHRATTALIELGHTRIAHLSGPAHAESAGRRTTGYLKAMVDHGLPPGPILEADYSFTGGNTATDALLAAGAEATGVVVANIASASGLLVGLRAHGKRVPDDLSVIAIHDHPLAGAFDPPLTTVRMPLFEIGRRAVALLLDTDPQDAIEEIIPDGIELIPRASTAPPRT